MALQKSLVNPSTGHVATYWRIDDLPLGPRKRAGTIALGGYASAQAAADGLDPLETRNIHLDRAAFVALAFAAPQSATVYGSVASPCYAFVRDQRRPITADTITHQDGGVTLPTGEHFTADQVSIVDGQITVPGEFADALDV